MTSLADGGGGADVVGAFEVFGDSASAHQRLIVRTSRELDGYVLLRDSDKRVALVPRADESDTLNRRGRFRVAPERRGPGRWEVVARQPDGQIIGSAVLSWRPGLYRITVKGQQSFRLTKGMFPGRWRLTSEGSHLATLHLDRHLFRSDASFVAPGYDDATVGTVELSPALSANPDGEFVLLVAMQAIKTHYSIVAVEPGGDGGGF